MKPVYVDTSFLIAAFNERDRWHPRILRASKVISGRNLLTTDLVLGEFLNFFCDNHPRVRLKAVSAVRNWLAGKRFESVTPARQLFLDGVSFYERRSDQSYSLTDCVSMVVMRTRRVEEVLTTDEHFAQEGFLNLLTPG